MFSAELQTLLHALEHASLTKCLIHHLRFSVRFADTEWLTPLKLTVVAFFENKYKEYIENHQMTSCWILSHMGIL